MNLHLNLENIGLIAFVVLVSFSYGKCFQDRIQIQKWRLCFTVINNPLRVCDPNFYFILYSETQCILKLDKIGIFIDMKFH